MGFYVDVDRPSAATEWVIYLQGGGWCANDAAIVALPGYKHTDETVAHPDLCSAREATYHGSTRNDFRKRTLAGRGYLSDDADENPEMHAWRKAIVRNCDGSLFMLNATVDGRPMRGWANLVGALKHLAAELRRRMNKRIESPLNFEKLVLGCICRCWLPLSEYFSFFFIF